MSQKLYSFNFRLKGLSMENLRASCVEFAASSHTAFRIERFIGPTVGLHTNCIIGNHNNFSRLEFIFF